MLYLSILLLFAKIDKYLSWTEKKQEYPSDDKFIKLFFPIVFFFFFVILSFQRVYLIVKKNVKMQQEKNIENI